MVQLLGGFCHNLGFYWSSIGPGASSPTYAEIVNFDIVVDRLAIRISEWLLLLHHGDLIPDMRLLTLTLDRVLIRQTHLLSMNLTSVISLHLRSRHIWLVDELNVVLLFYRICWLNVFLTIWLWCIFSWRFWLHLILGYSVVLGALRRASSRARRILGVDDFVFRIGWLGLLCLSKGILIDLCLINL